MRSFLRAALACGLTLLAGCSAGLPKNPPIVHCVAWHPVLRVDATHAHIEPGACSAWKVGGRYTGGWRR